MRKQHQKAVEFRLDEATNGSRLGMILYMCSFLTLLYSLSLLPPALVSLYYADGEAHAFLKTFGMAAFVGSLGWMVSRDSRQTLRPRDGFLIVALFWAVFSLLSALPFWLSHTLGFSLVNALFEGISGITTTGGTVINDVDAQAKSMLYFRAQLNFFGGLGIIVLAMAILPMLGIGGSQVFQSESAGPQRDEKLTPRLADTAKSLWLVYSGLGAACTLAYWLAGMDWFDAICHALSTVSIGGFSTHTASIAHFNSLPIEVVAGLFNILAAFNFALYYKIIARRSLTPLLTNAEVQFFMVVLGLVVSATCIHLYLSGTFPLLESLVHGYFVSISIMTGNGLVGGNYPSWPMGTVFLLLLASFFGGCVGSTCGGIKAARFLLLYRQSLREVQQLIHPKGFFTLKVQGKAVADREMQAVWGFFFLYGICTCAFVMILVYDGLSIADAFGTVAGCINNMGVGYGITASSFDPLSDMGKWLMCAAMLLGRLEVFPVLVLLSRAFWRF